MKKKLLIINISTLVIILSMISTQATFAATYTSVWHSSIKQDASFKWKVTKHVNDPKLTVRNDTLGSIYEVKITDDPPEDSFSGWVSAIEWADLYIDGDREQEEGFILVFVTPLNYTSSNETVPGYYIPYTMMAFIIALAGLFSGAIMDFSNKTENGLWTGHIESTFKISDVKHDLTIDMVYSTSTGLLERFYYSLENSTVTEEYELTKSSGNPLEDFLSPGFVISSFIASLILIPILKKRH